LGFYDGCTFDISLILAQAVYEIQSTNVLNIIEVIPDIAGDFYGITGWCELDSAGDRKYTYYEIGGFGYDNGEPGFLSFGFFDAITGEVMWW
jgi:hypothetical protein